MAAVSARPNIRIEIQNNLAEPMEVDENENQEESDFEDGEINDDSKEVNNKAECGNARIWNNKEGGFATGIDIFNKEEEEKLQERANRFRLDPKEINNFTNEDHLKLYESLGITTNNEKDVRFEAIHLRGTDEMSTEDVFEYFGKYLPSCIEWIDDESCNVLWQDKLSAARALHFISKAVKGMPVEGSCDPFIKDKEMNEEENRSILLTSTREIEIVKEDADDNEHAKEDLVNVNEISAPIPRGYWRFGIAHPKAKCLLLRFAFKTDKKPLKAEKFSEYYKKYGNPNFGGLKGIISASCRNKFRGIFDRNKDITNSLMQNSKNPWGDLAENWYADERFNEHTYIQTSQVNVDEPQKVLVLGKSEVLKRLGSKRVHKPEDATSEEGIKKISKVPRMRMYADEEEIKIKRKKQLLQVKLEQNKQELSRTNDLRNMIGNSRKEIDLGTKLRNRQSKENVKNGNSALEGGSQESSKYSGREKSRSHPNLQERYSKHPRDLSVQKHESRHSHKSYRNKMHSDRYHSERHLHSKDYHHSHKPRSKVAVVIKTQKRPTVASTIWSRITPKKERLKTASERLQSRRDSSSSSETSSTGGSSSSSSSESESSDTSSESEEESNDQIAQGSGTLSRPGFTNATGSSASTNRKSPLRIEINNDHFKEE
ncbi:hypothetical protein FQA39_LY08623 [Lamprigera yunnana]|nr:hypothetical protein FQA39_LY08623 [Lamprigera yunnana]